MPLPTRIPTEGSGSSTFTGLTDSPSSYADYAGKFVRVVATENGLEFADIAAADLPSGIDATKIGTGVVDNTEFGYLDGVTSGIQGQLNDKVSISTADTITAVHTFNPGTAGAPFTLGANATGQLVDGLNADKLDGQDAPTGDIVGTTDTQTLTNKTIDAASNTISDIGASEVEPGIISDQTVDTAPDGAADYVLTYDNSAAGLKKVLLNDLPSSGDSQTPWTSNIDAAGYDLANLGTLNFDDATTLTIASGAVTKTQSYHFIDTEGAAASDDLDTINGGTAGDLLYLKAADGTHTVVLKHGTGNIVTPDGNDYSLDDANKMVALVFDGANWHLVGSAGGSGSSTFIGDTDTPSGYTGYAGYSPVVNVGETALEWAKRASITTADMDIYVDGTNGDDTTGDGSSSNPYATVQHAVDTVSSLIIAHDITIHVADGTYTLSTPITIANIILAGGSLTLIGNTTTPSNVVFDGNNTAENCLIIQRSLVTIKGFRVTGATDHGIVAKDSATVYYDHLESVSNGGSGIYVVNKSAMTGAGASNVANFTITDNSGVGVWVSNGSKVDFAKDSIGDISNNGNDGFYVYGKSYGNLQMVSLNSNAQSGVDANEQSYVLIYQCTTTTNNDKYGAIANRGSYIHLVRASSSSLTGSSGEATPTTSGSPDYSVVEIT